MEENKWTIYDASKTCTICKDWVLKDYRTYSYRTRQNARDWKKHNSRYGTGQHRVMKISEVAAILEKESK